jgi:hypothetical protein
MMLHDSGVPSVEGETNVITSDRFTYQPSEKGNPPASSTSQIEQIHWEIVKCHRWWDKLDDLASDLSSGGSSEADSGENKLRNKKLINDAQSKVNHVTAQIEALTRALLKEEPITAREVLIFELHPRWFARYPLENFPACEGAEEVIEHGELADRFVSKRIAALEKIAGVTCKELGCTGWYFEGSKDDEPPTDDKIESLIKEMEKSIAA